MVDQLFSVQCYKRVNIIQIYKNLMLDLDRALTYFYVVDIIATSKYNIINV